MPLKLGTKAFMIVGRTSGTQSKSGERRQVEGAAQVVVEDYHDGLYHVKVLKGAGVAEGRIVTCARHELFLKENKEEAKYFEQLVDWFWGNHEQPTMDRPPVED